jgi:hypothetical protein
MMRVTRKELKPLLQEALDRYPVMREKCLNLRERLLKLYHFDAILDMAQAQIDGHPISSDYVTKNLRPIKSGKPAGSADK